MTVHSCLHVVLMVAILHHPQNPAGFLTLYVPKQHEVTSLSTDCVEGPGAAGERL